jgi:serine phosphatase RsbU (regulator of sigma subunit)
MPEDGPLFTAPFETRPEPTPAERAAAADLRHARAAAQPTSVDDTEAAQTLVRHLFAQNGQSIPGIRYHVANRLAERNVGGDVIDVFHFDNGSTAFSIADISGKGVRSAVSAALVKYGLRAFISQGFTTERVLRSLDRLFLENNAFERTEFFASVFIAIVDDERTAISYASAGHEPVILVRPNGSVRVLAPTAPLVGIFDDQHHLFKQRTIEIESGALLVGTTDGITEARSPDGVFFGMDGFINTVAPLAHAEPEAITTALMDAVTIFTGGRFHDDIALFAVRFI